MFLGVPLYALAPAKHHLPPPAALRETFMDYFIIAITTLAGLVFHGWLFVRFRRWADRDLALALAGSDPQRRTWALQRLAEAKAQGVRRKDLENWLKRELEDSGDLTD